MNTYGELIINDDTDNKRMQIANARYERKEAAYNNELQRTKDKLEKDALGLSECDFLTKHLVMQSNLQRYMKSLKPDAVNTCEKEYLVLQRIYKITNTTTPNNFENQLIKFYDGVNYGTC